MTKLILDDTAGGYDLSTLNDNNDKIETEFQDKVLYRDNPIGEPNTMENDFDMNSNDILNAGTINTDRLFIDGEEFIIAGTEWGKIEGTLADQADLQAALDTKIENVVDDTTPVLGGDLTAGWDGSQDNTIEFKIDPDGSTGMNWSEFSGGAPVASIKGGVSGSGTNNFVSVTTDSSNYKVLLNTDDVSMFGATVDDHVSIFDGNVSIEHTTSIDLDAPQVQIGTNKMVVTSATVNGQVLTGNTDGTTSWEASPIADVSWGDVIGTLSNQTDLQSALNAKAASVHTHAISDVTSLQTTLDGKALIGGDASQLFLVDTPTLADHAVTKAYSDSIAGISDAPSDGKQYARKDAGWDDLTPTFAGKANSVHTHAISDVTGLQTALDGKAALAGSGSQVFSVATPTIDAHAATKKYVDDIVIADSIKILGTQTFTANGSFVIPAGTQMVIATCRGAGGGGGNGDSTNGGGGGACGYLTESTFQITTGTIDVVIGAGGAAGVYGGITTLKNALTMMAQGGKGGEGGTAGGGGGPGISNAGLGTSGGTGTGGDGGSEAANDGGGTGGGANGGNGTANTGQGGGGGTTSGGTGGSGLVKVVALG